MDDKDIGTQIINILSGRQTDVSRETLCSMLEIRGFKIHPRKLQDEIARLQLDDYMIASGAHGYWLANKSEHAERLRLCAITRIRHAEAEKEDAMRYYRWAHELESLKRIEARTNQLTIELMEGEKA